MKNIAQPTEETVCEECGLRRKDWTGNNGRGIEARGMLACCAGCCEGAGCSCKETGVRRVVVALPEGADTKKGARRPVASRIKKWQSGLNKLARKSSN